MTACHGASTGSFDGSDSAGSAAAGAAGASASSAAFFAVSRAAERASALWMTAFSVSSSAYSKIVDALRERTPSRPYQKRSGGAGA